MPPELSLHNGLLPLRRWYEGSNGLEMTVQFPVLTAELELTKTAKSHFQVFITRRKCVSQSLPFQPPA